MSARDDFGSGARSPGGWGGQGNMKTTVGGGGHGSLGTGRGSNASGMGGMGGVGGGYGSNIYTVPGRNGYMPRDTGPIPRARSQAFVKKPTALLGEPAVPAEELPPDSPYTGFVPGEEYGYPGMNPAGTYFPPSDGLRPPYNGGPATSMVDRSGAWNMFRPQVQSPAYYTPGSYNSWTAPRPGGTQIDKWTNTPYEGAMNKPGFGK
jgi:hypothetical protein